MCFRMLVNWIRRSYHMFLCYLLLSNFIGMSTCIDSSFVRRADRKIEHSYIIKEQKLHNLLACLMVCTAKAKNDKCAWNDHSHLCQIGEEWNNGWKRYNTRVERAVGWTTYEKLRFSVSTYKGHGGWYWLSFQEAVDTCITMGSTIASLQTLLKAQAEGFGTCKCSWLSDGINGFVLQDYWSECWPFYTPGFYNCGFDYADVFCNVP